MRGNKDHEVKFRVSKEELLILDAFANEFGISRSAIFRLCIPLTFNNVQLEDTELFKQLQNKGVDLKKIYMAEINKVNIKLIKNEKEVSKFVLTLLPDMYNQMFKFLNCQSPDSSYKKLFETYLDICNSLKEINPDDKALLDIEERIKFISELNIYGIKLYMTYLKKSFIGNINIPLKSFREVMFKYCNKNEEYFQAISFIPVSQVKKTEPIIK